MVALTLLVAGIYLIYGVGLFVAHPDRPVKTGHAAAAATIWDPDGGDDLAGRRVDLYNAAATDHPDGP